MEVNQAKKNKEVSERREREELHPKCIRSLLGNFHVLPSFNSSIQEVLPVSQ